MKLISSLVIIAVAVGIGYYLATDDKEELISSIKEGFSEGKNMVANKVKKAAGNISDEYNSRKTSME